MAYLYYPGCSLKSTGRAYEESMRAVFAKVGIPLEELEDWNCCGATSYMSISELKAFALSARNFALAEKQGGRDKTTDLIVPCAACYLGLSKAHKYLDEFPDIRSKVDEALAAAGLKYSNNLKIRHPLDVLVNDVKKDRLAGLVTQPLKGLKVACYYGCQIVRPYAEFDNQDSPQSMEKIFRILGAETIDWPIKTRCCGGSLSGTVPEVGLRLSYLLLLEATRRGADCIATACPLCQFNLECYQPKMSSKYNEKIDIPVLYFTQLAGIAMGLGEKELGLQRLFVPMRYTPAPAASSGGQHVTK